MKGTIVNYRSGRHTQTTNQMIVSVKDVSKEQAQKLVGKTVTYNTGKKDIKGKVQNAHGNSGAVRVLFETGMPGQSFGKSVSLD